MKEILNINEEISKMEQCVTKVSFCADTLTTVREECIIRMERMKLNTIMMIVSLYTLGMVGMRLFGSTLLKTQYYLILAVISTFAVYKVYKRFIIPTMSNVGTICMLTVATASISPVLPDLLYVKFAAMSSTTVAIVRIFSLFLLALAWMIVMSGDKQRNRRLKAIWDSLEG